jgi:hypothetical protein
MNLEDSPSDVDGETEDEDEDEDNPPMTTRRSHPGRGRSRQTRSFRGIKASKPAIKEKPGASDPKDISKGVDGVGLKPTTKEKQGTSDPNDRRVHGDKGDEVGDNEDNDDNDEGPRGSMPAAMKAEVWAARAKYEKEMEQIALRYKRPVMTAYREAGEAVIKSRDPNLFNIFEKWWVAEDGNNAKVPENGTSPLISLVKTVS